MSVTVNVSFNAYACHEVHFVAKFTWSRTYVPKSSRHEVTFHHNGYINVKEVNEPLQPFEPFQRQMLLQDR